MQNLVFFLAAITFCGRIYILLQIRVELWHGHVYPTPRSAALETRPTNATIRKDSKFVLDFAARNIKIDAVVAELAQLWCILAERG